MHLRGLFDLFLHQVCHDKRKEAYDKDMMVEINSNIQSVLAYHEAKFDNHEAEKHIKALKACDFDDIDDCSLFQDVKDSRRRDELQNCVQDPSRRECALFDKGCTDSTVSYLAANYCQEETVKYMKGYDFVVLNCGHHAAKEVDFSYKMYKGTIDLLANELSTFLPKNPKTQFIWVENSAEPIRADVNYQQSENKKTYHRLLLFDSIARLALKKFKVRFSTIASFSSTLPLYDKMCDCVHYPKSAKMPQLLELVDMMQRPALSVNTESSL